MIKATHKPLLSRRRFLDSFSRAAGSAALFAMGLGVLSQSARSLPAQALRPPGALAEHDFLAACVRCGLCVRDCPFDTLKLSRLGENIALGTPYFEARKVPCEMCEDIPCVNACPTGALDHQLSDINHARMGLAVMIDQESCIAFQGLRCEVCYNVCPRQGEAISLKRSQNRRTGKHALIVPEVHSSDCTGCGKCEHACILPEAAIKVLPHKLAQGASAEHYRLGWEEKRKAGKSLVTPDIQHRYNLPEGMRYDYKGEGLMPEDSKPSRFDANSHLTKPDKVNPGKVNPEKLNLEKLNRGLDFIAPEKSSTKQPESR